MYCELRGFFGDVIDVVVLLNFEIWVFVVWVVVGMVCDFILFFLWIVWIVFRFLFDVVGVWMDKDKGVNV